jgi:hypothetical protein
MITQTNIPAPREMCGDGVQLHSANFFSKSQKVNGFDFSGHKVTVEGI